MHVFTSSKSIVSCMSKLCLYIQVKKNSSMHVNSKDFNNKETYKNTALIYVERLFIYLCLIIVLHVMSHVMFTFNVPCHYKTEFW